jgi:membrane-associated protease RseP (regulator of RpoE activity)
VKKPKIKISIAGVISLAILYILNGKEIFITMILCSLIHELGHLFTMLLLKVSPTEITVGFFNFNIQYNKLKTKYRDDILISVSGIIFNLITAIVAFRLCIETVFYVSIALAIINALPINGIDGGNILESIKLMLSFRKSEKLDNNSCFENESEKGDLCINGDRLEKADSSFCQNMDNDIDVLNNEKILYDRKVRLYNKIFAPAFICFVVLISGFNLSVVFSCVSAVICKTID